VLSRFIIWEKNHVKDYIHKISRRIVELALRHNMRKTVIDDVHKSITQIDIGNQNNEEPRRIPFGKLVAMIKYKANKYGIEVESNKSYTSKTCSFKSLSTNLCI